MTDTFKHADIFINMCEGMPRPVYKVSQAVSGCFENFAVTMQLCNLSERYMPKKYNVYGKRGSL